MKIACLLEMGGFAGSHGCAAKVTLVLPTLRTRWFTGTTYGAESQQMVRSDVNCGDAQNINNAARNMDLTWYMRVAHSFMTGLNVPPPCARAF